MYKSYYLGVSGNDLDRISVKSALLRIGDFESLTYKQGAHKTVSRLKLLVSPSSRPPSGRGSKKKTDAEINEETNETNIFCMRRVSKDSVEIIEENGHLGCGFIPKSLLVEVIGNSKVVKKISDVNDRVFAIQVRAIGPSSVGIAKGMLFVKDGIEKIQLPASMIKVAPSKTKPLHDDVVLNITGCFPSMSNQCMGRYMNKDLKDPTVKQLKTLKPPFPDALRVLQSKGVDQVVLQQCEFSPH